MKKIKLLLLFLIISLPFFIAKPAFAGFGISPAEIYNDHLKLGAKFETEIVLSRSEADEDLNIVIETDLGEIESWVKFEPSKEFLFPKGEKRKIIKTIITVPNNAETKNYKGLLRIKTSSLDATGSGVSIVQGARMEVTLITTVLNVNILNIKGTRIPDVDSGKPIKLFTNIENTGNTEIAPDKIIFEIQRLNKESIETQEATKLEKVSSNTTKEISTEFKNNLDGGEYFGNVKIYSDDKEIYSNRLVFKVNSAKKSLTQDKSTKTSFLGRLVNLVKNNKAESVAVVSIISLPVIIGYILSKKPKLFILKKIFFVFILLYLSVSLIILYNYHQKRLSNMAKPGDIGFVQGETTEITPTIVKQPIDNSSSLVVNKESESGYPIYRIPDITSPVVYTAAENEKLSVISEIEGWFQVSAGDGTDGWLPKTSVKKTE